MGISGLLPLLRSITRRVHIKELAGQAVAIDAYSWLHKGVYGACAVDLFHGRPNFGYIDSCLAKIKLLLSFNVRPILVFDGARLPIKSHQESLRRSTRDESRQKALELLASGNHQKAFLLIQRASDITPQMAYRLMRELRRLSVEFVVAPYEADAQMAWLDRIGRVAAIITEDSDLLLFGCRRVLFKMDREGWTEEIRLDRLYDVKEVDLTKFTFDRFRHMCMLSGCDYLPSIPGLGLKTAHRYLCQYGTVNRIISMLRAQNPGRVPSTYEEDFGRAELTFRHQRVWDEQGRRLCFLTPLPLHMDAEECAGDRWDFLGPLIDNATAEAICTGLWCPDTRVPFVDDNDDVNGNGGDGMRGFKEQQKQRRNNKLPFTVNLDLPAAGSAKLMIAERITRKRIMEEPLERISTSQSLSQSFSQTSQTNHQSFSQPTQASQPSQSMSTISLQKFAFSTTVVAAQSQAMMQPKRQGSLPITKVKRESNQRTIKDFFQSTKLQE